MHTTIDDLLLFANASLSGNGILDDTTLLEMRTPLKEVKSNYGMGYMTMNMGPIKIQGHAGSNTGWQSAFFLDFNLKSGLIMLSNGSEGENVLRSILREWQQWKSGELSKNINNE